MWGTGMNGDYLTMAEIEAKYPNEWVLIDQPKVDRRHQMLGGVVVAHSPKREPVEGYIGSLPRPFDIAVWYTGRLNDENEVFCL